MNTLSNLLIMLIFIYVSLVVGVPGTNTDNILRQKFFLFAGITIFQFLLHVVTQIKKNPEKRVKVNDMISDSIQVASAAVIGFSVYVDEMAVMRTTTAMTIALVMVTTIGDEDADRYYSYYVAVI